MYCLLLPYLINTFTKLSLEENIKYKESRVQWLTFRVYTMLSINSV